METIEDIKKAVEDLHSLVEIEGTFLASYDDIVEALCDLAGEDKDHILHHPMALQRGFAEIFLVTTVSSITISGYILRAGQEMHSHTEYTEIMDSNELLHILEYCVMEYEWCERTKYEPL